MLLGAPSVSVLAAELIETLDNSLPIVSISPKYYYDGSDLNEEFRALPDSGGTFYFSITVNKAPETDEDLKVYYRTTDYGAVAEWGDYESVGVHGDAYVVLNKANNYTTTVSVKSKLMDYATINIKDGVQDDDRIISRRFLFELIGVEGNAVLREDDPDHRSSVPCYLRAEDYIYTQAHSSGKYGSNITRPDLYTDMVAYMNLDNPISTDYIRGKGSRQSSINYQFSEEFINTYESGYYKLGISIIGKCTEQYWQEDGPVIFDLYYTINGQKKKALTLTIEGEFDDSTFFGWEHAYDYAYNDGNDEWWLDYLNYNKTVYDIAINRKDFIDDNFYGITVYDNDGNVAYTVNKDDTRDENIIARRLRETVDNGLCITPSKNLELHSIEYLYFPITHNQLHWLTLPSNFLYADSYSWAVYSETGSSKARRLDNVFIICRLLENESMEFEKDEQGNSMITTNVGQLREGDPLRVFVRFNQFATMFGDKYGDPAFITAKINGKYDVTLKLKEMGTNAWDTFVFECDLPPELQNEAITSLTYIKLDEGRKDSSIDLLNGILALGTQQRLINNSIGNIYFEHGKDLRTPVANISAGNTANWVKSKSIDLFLNTKENTASRFNDYTIVYYQWSNSSELPQRYNSSIAFDTYSDGEVMKTIIGTGNGEMYLHLKSVSSYGKISYSDALTGWYDPSDASAVYTPFGPFKFDNAPPEFSADDIVVSGSLRERVISFELPKDEGSSLQSIHLYCVPKNSENGQGTLLKKFTPDSFSGDPLKLDYTISHKDVGIGVDEQGNVILERGEIEFYFELTDRLGNTTGRTADFKLVFDTNDYLSDEIKSFNPFDISADTAKEQFVVNTTKIDDFTYIYDFSANKLKEVSVSNLPDGYKDIRYGVAFTVDSAAFGSTDNGIYGAIVSYNGEEVTDYTVTTMGERTIVWFHSEMLPGRYDIRLTRTEGDSVRVSMAYTVYSTDAEDDMTDTRAKIESGTLLNNKVYQLSTLYPYFYYKDADGNRQQEYYNGTKQPATFSSYAKAKEYVYYRELSDIYLVQLTAATASALNSGTAGYLIAKGETVTPQAGQYWIRYKSDSWTPTSGDNSWVYYYYGMSDELNEGALSANLQTALNTVAKRIADYGSFVVLTDASLFLGAATGDKMLDKYGMPYLHDGQIHSTDEISTETMCGNKWAMHVYYLADKSIYLSNVYVGVEGTENYKKYPIIGNFTIAPDARYQYMTYEEYAALGTWKELTINAGESFIHTLKGSGVYYIREMSYGGVAVYAIYVDKVAPDVDFYKTGDNGELVEVPVDGVEITDIRVNSLIIGAISPTEYDRLSYVAVYRVSNLSLVGVYTADELDHSHIRLEDGNYYIVVSDRSGNHYTVTAKVSSSDLDCVIKETKDKFIKLTCNRKADQILRYEIYLNGDLITSTYAAEQTFEKAGLYNIYVQDIYGNVYSEEYIFNRNYPTVTWKYLASDGKYHIYDSNTEEINGFVMTWVSDNKYKISTAVKTRFSFSEAYEFEFVGTAPKYTATVGVETVVTIEEGQSFTLKVYYKNHKDCYTVYSGVVDITPPTIGVSADVDILVDGERSLFDKWLADGELGDIIVLDELYYALTSVGHSVVNNGGSIISDIIKINVTDANDLSSVEVYLDGELLKRQDSTTGFSQIIVSRSGNYRIVAKDTLGNVAEFNFINGKQEDVKYYVDGIEKEIELHGYRNFETVDGKHVYTKVDYGNDSFKLCVNENGNVFLSVGVTGGATEIYGFFVSDGCVYPMTYKIVLNKDGREEIDLVVGDVILDVNAVGFKTNTDYLLNENGAYPIYASVSADKEVTFKVYAPDDASKIASVNARIEIQNSNMVFVASEISKKASDLSFKDLTGSAITGKDSDTSLYVNDGFTVDESTFDGERVLSVSLYYSNLNNLDVNALEGKIDIYAAGEYYTDEGFYLLVVKNRFGNDKVYNVAISRSFGITSSVTFGDGYKLYYSKDYNGNLYSNNEITLDILEDGVTVVVKRNGTTYNGFVTKTDAGVSYIVFNENGSYEVTLTDSYGNEIVRYLEIDKSSYSVTDGLLTGYNENALKRDEGYTNKKISVDKDVFDSDGIYYLAIKYGEIVKVLFDAFSEVPVNTGAQNLVDVIGNDGDGLYTVICRNRYGAVVTKDIHYRSTPTLKLARNIRSQSGTEEYDLAYALTLGFWSNNTLIFNTDAETYIFTVNGNVTECPRTLVFENAGDFGSFEYDITYLDEYGFEYRFKAYLVRKNVDINLAPTVTGIEINGILNTQNNISITFGENVYATYTRNNGEEMLYRSGDVLRMDGTYRFTVTDYAGNASTLTVKKDTAVEFAFVESSTGTVVQNGSVVNVSKVALDILNKDTTYIERVLKDGVVQKDFTDTKFTEDGKWEIILSDKLGNKAYFSFYIVTKSQNGFSYTTPYEYRITEMWYDNGDGVKISYMAFVNHTDLTSSFDFTENGKYTAVMTSDVTGNSTEFKFTVNTLAPEVTLVGCEAGETTINDVTVNGCKVGDRVKVYRATDMGEELVAEVEVTSVSTKIPTVTEGGKYRIVVESEAGVATELAFVRKHVMNTAGSVFIMVVIGLAVVGLFTGLVYRNKSKTDD